MFIKKGKYIYAILSLKTCIWYERKITIVGHAISIKWAHLSEQMKLGWMCQDNPGLEPVIPSIMQPAQIRVITPVLCILQYKDAAKE